MYLYVCMYVYIYIYITNISPIAGKPSESPGKRNTSPMIINMYQLLFPTLICLDAADAVPNSANAMCGVLRLWCF